MTVARPSSRAASAVAYELVTTPGALADLVERLRSEDVYAVDTEFHRERTYFPRLGLVQLAWRAGVALVDPLAVDPAPLAEVLAGPGLAVVHAGDQDLEVLERACGARPRHLFDTQLAAGFLGLSSPSLSSLAARLLGIRLEKGDRLADWTRRPLTEAQLRYAAGDVAHLLELWQVLTERLRAAGRLAWAEAECAALLERPRLPPVPEEAWWRLRHARQLHGRERAVAQAVAAWRERRAAELDVPPRYVLSDLALGAICHRPPTTPAELARVRGLDGRQATSIADDLLAAVAAGLAAPLEDVRLPPPAPEEAAPKAALALVAAWTAERARTLGIDPALLATRADLADFLRRPPTGRLTRSWRNAIVGEPIARLLAGEAALALEDGTIVLERRSRVCIPEPAVPTA
ncbi:MAG TPA: HRDC domain-containing protein [Acidimicrobiales bacterium]|nr:HRDC domain-containing protein [Acidimicrobiales bacterium]